MKIRLLTTALLLLSAGPVLAADWADARTNTPTTALPPAPAAPANPPAAPPQSEPETDITAPLRQSPPAPPSAAEAWAIGQAAPLNRSEIENVSRAVDDASRGRAWQPADVVPRISTLTVNLSPGASLPVLRTATHQASTVMFTDNTGAPWPLAAPPYNANSDGFTVNFIPDSSVMTVQARRQYDRGNVTVYLKGLAVPIIVDVTSGEASNKAASRVIDTRLDLRIPQRGPQAKKMPAPQSKIGPNDPTLQAFLDGVPPQDARRLKTEGAVPDTQVWQMGDDLFIRLILALGFMFGLGGCIFTLFSVAQRARSGKPASGLKALVSVCLGGALIALQQMMNKAAHTLSFGDVSFDAIAYAPDSMGQAKLAIDAVLTLLRAVGVLFFFMGLSRIRRSLVDGHTGLSAREDVSAGMVMLICGILLACNPQLLNALQNTLHLSWN